MNHASVGRENKANPSTSLRTGLSTRLKTRQSQFQTTEACPERKKTALNPVEEPKGQRTEYR